MTPSTMETKMGALVTVLDEDIRHVERVLSQLDALRALLIKRDDAGLEGLLEEVRQQAERYAANEQRRQSLRQELAVQVGCAERDLTLSKLVGELRGPSRVALAARQARLRNLVAQLKREHTLTTFLLGDCARFNRSLLRAFFGLSGRGQLTYHPAGAAKPQVDAALMSLQL